MPFTQYFSASYQEARKRFIDLAAQNDATLIKYEVKAKDGQTLYIDIAKLGPEDAKKTLVLSSAMHGVEGYFGSAAQLAWLDRLKEQPLPTGCNALIIHAINPIGFDQIRRVNEDNVDLNRNFHDKPERYKGSPAGYAELNDLLNPESPQSRWEPFKLKTIWHILRRGLPSIKNAVAGGQYEFPRGIFFGGQRQTASTRILQREFRRWIGNAETIVHIDFHTGLGPFGDYKLLLSEQADSPKYRWYTRTFGENCVEPFAAADKTAYATRGDFGSWLLGHFADRDYRFVTAEFGTYNVISVVGSMRTENRAHFHSDPQSVTYQKAKQDLLETFVPADPVWRNKVIKSSLSIIDQAVIGSP